jgi:hypothetical protein
MTVWWEQSGNIPRQTQSHCRCHSDAGAMSTNDYWAKWTPLERHVMRRSGVQIPEAAPCDALHRREFGIWGGAYAVSDGSPRRLHCLLSRPASASLAGANGLTVFRLAKRADREMLALRENSPSGEAPWLNANPAGATGSRSVKRADNRVELMSGRYSPTRGDSE